MVSYTDRLAWAMKQANVTALELSKVMGVSKLAVRKVLEGRSGAFTAYNSAVAARFLNVNSDWLATGEGAPQRLGEEEQAVARRYGRLGPDGRHLLNARLLELESGG